MSVLRSKDIWLGALGFGALDVWFAASGFILPTARDQWADMVALASFALAMLLCAALARRLERRLSRTDARSALCLSAIPLAMTALSPLPAAQSAPVALVLAALTGVALALLMIGWGMELCGTDPNALIAQVALSFLCMLAFHSALTALSAAASAIARAAAPLLSGILLTTVTGSSACQYDQNQAPRTGAARMDVFIRLLLAVNALSLVVNVIYNLYRFNSGFDFNSVRFLMIALQAGFLVAVLALDAKLSLTGRALYAATCAIIALSCLLFPVHGLGSVIPFGVLFIGFLSLDVLAVYLSVRVCPIAHVSPVASFALTQGSFLGLQIVFARSIGPLVAESSATSPRIQSIVTLLGVGLVGFAYFVIFNDKMAFSALPGELEPSPASTEGAGEPPNEESRWNAFADSHRLTAREREVLFLFYKGRSYVRIQEMLSISRGTVNTHMASCYRKLGVASRQELIDLYEKEASGAGGAPRVGVPPTDS